MNPWVEAARPRTLPLALSSILLGNILSASQGSFNPWVFLWSILTTLSLQILSNFANDYGDSQSGLDNAQRKVAKRTVQTGKISPSSMKQAIVWMTLLGLASGMALIYEALWHRSWNEMLGFFALGLCCILAAITYTVGKKPYGYLGYGDISVFVFFGLVGTLGSYYLQKPDFQWPLLLPAAGLGFLSVAVLNLNNLRDLENDRANGKFSIPVRIGKAKGIAYQKALYYLGIACFLLYAPGAGLHFIGIQHVFMFFAIFPIGVLSYQMKPELSSEALDPFLKKTALSTLWLILSFGTVILLMHA